MSRVDPELNHRRLPSYVHNVSTAQCLFCPYGVDGKVGERVYAFDERTVLQHQTRERLVVITAIKMFHSDGARITLDGKPASAFELAQIMQDSKLTLTALLDHRNGSLHDDPEQSPVVVYFSPCDQDDTVGRPFRPETKFGSRSRWSRLFSFR